MKKLFLLSFLSIGLGLSAFAQTAPATTTPASAPSTTPTTTAAVSDANASVFKFNTESHDFGTFSQGTPASYEFLFSNIGKSPLVITNVVASCGCTTPKWSKDPIAPGATGSVVVSYDTNRVGPFSKSVTISSNSTTPSKVLFIKGVVQAKKAAGTL